MVKGEKIIRQNPACKEISVWGKHTFNQESTFPNLEVTLPSCLVAFVGQKFSRQSLAPRTP
jgi:hypothetical protein